MSLISESCQCIDYVFCITLETMHFLNGVSLASELSGQCKTLVLAHHGQVAQNCMYVLV